MADADSKPTPTLVTVAAMAGTDNDAGSEPAKDESAAAVAISKAETFQEAGRAHYQAGDYKAALAEYHAIFMYVHGHTGQQDAFAGLGGGSRPRVSENEMRRLAELKLVHFSNVGLCHLKLGSATKCITYCTKALALDPDNVKCLFRRGKCRLDEGELEGAREDLLRAQGLDGTNREVALELRRLRALSTADDKKLARKFAKVFAAMSAEDDDGGGVNAPPIDTAAEPAGSKIVAGDDDDIGEPLGPPQDFMPEQR
ncbi:hypothetical protein T492DRAFT_1090557 [Pavlovales sp. CCMP2436]|nr:hypothetical protein T492DRAFT_1090557 [Pavlovales sp. CCMP2436]